MSPVKRRQKMKRAGKWMRLHIALTAIVFGLYFMAAFLYSPHFFVSDINDKFHALADDTIVITAQVLDVPGKPVVTATASCISGNPSVALDWADDSNTYTYDVLRDGSTIASGLIVSTYQDMTTVLGVDYVYTVTAYGPMGPGFATSDPISINATAACLSTPPISSSHSNASSSSHRSHESKKSSNTQQPPSNPGSHLPVTPDSISFDFSVHIVGGETAFIQGDTIESEITIERIDSAHASDPVVIRYSLVGADGASVSIIDTSLDHVTPGQVIRQRIALPADMQQGGYTLHANMTIGTAHRVRSAAFSVMELPLVTLQSGVVITYPQVVRHIGWIAFTMLFLLLWWLLVWIREYWLYAHATRHIAERNLSGKGLITKRKEVSS